MAALNTRGFNQLMKSVAQRKARSRLLSSSARHQAQQRNGYITENGLDREDARKSRQELNETAGKTEIKNLKWQSEHGGMRDYVAERAAKKTAARNSAVEKMKGNTRERRAKENIDKGINKDNFWKYARDASKKDSAKQEADYQMRYAQFLNTNDREKEIRKGYGAIDRKGQQQKRAKKW